MKNDLTLRDDLLQALRTRVGGDRIAVALLDLIQACDDEALLARGRVDVGMPTERVIPVPSGYRDRSGDPVPPKKPRRPRQTTIEDVLPMSPSEPEPKEPDLTDDEHRAAACDAGIAAYLRGDRKGENPWHPSQYERAAWDAGWDAEAARESAALTGQK